MADTHELTSKPNENGFHSDPDDVWGLPERTAQDAEFTETPSQAEQRRMRSQGALAMRIRGADYGEIATVLEYASASDARRAVEHLLAEVSEADGPGAWQTQRQVARLRLEGLLAAVYPIALQPSDEGFFAAQRQAVTRVDRINVLDGLNAPTRHVVYSPAAAEFDAVVQKVLESSGIHEPHEGDIFELAEIVIDPDEAEEGELDAEEDEH